MMTFPLYGKNKSHVPNHQPVTNLKYDLLGMIPLIKNRDSSDGLSDL